MEAKILIAILLLLLSDVKSLSVSRRSLSSGQRRHARPFSSCYKHCLLSRNHASFDCAFATVSKERFNKRTRRTTSSTTSMLFPSSNNNAGSSPSVAESKIRRKGRIRSVFQNTSRVSNNFLKNMKAAPFALAVATFVVGFRFGRKTTESLLFKSTAATSGSSSAASVSTSTSSVTRGFLRQYPLVVFILLVISIRDIWSLIPNWLKKNIPLVGRKIAGAKEEIEEDDADDLTSLPALSNKLRTLFQVGQKKLQESGSEEIQNPYLVFVATLRLLSQFKQQRSERRDKLYESAGQDVPNPIDVLDEKVQESLEFADWAYEDFKEGETLKEKLATKGFNLLRHEKIPLPGQVAHYVAFSPEEKTVLIGIKGTSSFEDMLTDCCGRSVNYTLEGGPMLDGGSAEIHCHEGLLLSAKRLVDDLQDMVRYIVLPIGYKIVVTGHSLGAGVAALFSIILKSRIESLRNDNGDKLKVLAFAPPPVLDFDAALACEGFVTSYVNNCDIVTRASLSNLVVLMEFMKLVSKKLEERGLSPTGYSSGKAFLKMLTSGKDGEMLMDPEDIKVAVEDAFEKVELRDPDHLYVPGKVIHMYDLWSKEGYADRSDYEGVKDSDDIPRVRTSEKVHISDGTSKPMRLIEIDKRMLSDHMPRGYRSSISSLLEKSQKKIPESNTRT